MARRGLEAAYGKDGSSPGACPGCGGRPRLLRRERAGTEAALDRVEMEMACFACRKCGCSWRPREKSLGIEGSMTLSARRLASVAGSETSYAKADELLRELAAAGWTPRDVGLCLGDSDLAAAWAKKLCGMLGAERLDDALTELRWGDDVEECRRVVRYLAERRDRTRYDELRAAGLLIGSKRAARTSSVSA